jgi:hypothetical protein
MTLRGWLVKQEKPTSPLGRKRSLIGNSDIASMLARRLRGHVPLRAASPQHGRRLRVPGFFVCGVMCRCGLQAHSTVAPACAWVFRLRGHVPLRAASPQHGRRLRVPGFFVCGVMCRCEVKVPVALSVSCGTMDSLDTMDDDTCSPSVHAVHSVHSSLREQQLSTADRLRRDLQAQPHCCECAECQYARARLMYSNLGKSALSRKRGYHASKLRCCSNHVSVWSGRNGR